MIKKAHYTRFVMTAAVLLSTTFAAQASPVALQCGQVFDSIKGQVKGAAIITVDNGIIQSVGDTAPAGAEMIDLSGQTCLPGLMDAHAHLMLDFTVPSLEDSLGLSSAAKSLRAVKNAETMLMSGFTTARIPGDGDFQYGIIDVRNAIKRGDFPGPRLFVAPHFFSPVGGHADLNQVAADLVNGPKGTVVEAGTDKVRDAVRKEIKYGADWIKIMASGGVMSEGDDPNVQSFTDEEIKAFIEETHRYGKKITAHIHGDAPAYTAAKYGIDSIEHATMISRKTAKMMAKNNVRLISTAYVLDWIIDQGVKGGVSPDNLRKAQIVVETRKKAWEAAIDEGVTFVLGVDQIFPHNESAREFYAMTKAGLSPSEALRAGTINAADLFGIKDQAGSLEVGKWADIVAVPGNPLENIRLMEEVSFVMQAGKVVKNH